MMKRKKKSKGQLKNIQNAVTWGLFFVQNGNRNVLILIYVAHFDIGLPRRR
jgi:hypothetical protein